MRLALPVLVALGTSACQEPFGTDHHDLVGFRVAGITRVATDEGAALRAAVIVDGRPWSDAPVALAWYPLDEADPDIVASLGLDDEPAATGPSPVLRDDGRALALVATHGEQTWRGVLPATPAGTPPALDGIALTGVDLAVDSSAAALDLEARRALDDGPPIRHVPEGGGARLRAGVAEGVRVRWMSTAPSGTFFELDDRTTDWLAGEVLVDDDEIEQAEADPTGPRTMLALALSPDADAANAWAARDVHVGPPPRGVTTTSGRWLAVDAEITGPFVQGTLTADDDAPTGLTLTGAVDVPADTDPGTADLPCRVAVDGPFDPDWLLEQRCTRADVLGATVVVEVR